MSPGNGNRVARLRRSRGFTLLEVIVAFALLALALTLLLGTLSGAARQVRDSERASRASLHAQSFLTRLGVGESLETGQREGTFEEGRYRWVLQVQDYADPDGSSGIPDQSGSPKLRLLILDVRWGNEASQVLRWKTLRLVPGEGRT